MKAFQMNIASLLLTAAVAAGGNGPVARADLAKFPAEIQPFIFYITTAPLDEEGRESADIALRLAIPSVSRQRNLDACLPQRVEGSDTLYRINLQALNWDLGAWQRMVEDYPYLPKGNVTYRIFRADWLLIQLTDSQVSDAYYELLYGVRPKTRDEALKTFGINTDVYYSIGLIEGDSGVAVSGKRRLTNFPSGQRGIAWLTEDTLQTSPNADPLEFPQGGQKHDGEEGIIQIPKITKDGDLGYLQGYFLANGEGTIVNRAPSDLVVDHLQARKGIPEIRNGVSCIVCHSRGFNLPTTDEFREYLKAGVELYADYNTKEQIEAFFINTEKELRRANEDFEVAVTAACGVLPVEAAARFHSAVYRYDEPLTLERAAREVSMDKEEFRLAVANASAHGYKLGARVSGLAHDKTISRASWEAQYVAVNHYADFWRALQ